MQGRNFIPSGQQAANLGRQELGFPAIYSGPTFAPQGPYIF